MSTDNRREQARLRPQAFGELLLKVEHVSVLVQKGGQKLVDDISLELGRGKCIGIVGESGSGKTMLCRAITGLLPPGLTAGGSVLFEGRDLLQMREKDLRQVRGKGMSVILQQAMTAFDPLYSLGSQMTAIFRDRLAMTGKEAGDLAQRMLARTGLPERVMHSYPHELSGGMLQRCMIAVSLGLDASLVVADEPTTALDARNQYELLQLFRTLRENSGSAMILVSHDLGAVQILADEVLVMHNGICVEQGDAKSVFDNPAMPYTQHLVSTRLALSGRFARPGGGCHA